MKKQFFLFLMVFSLVLSTYAQEVVTEDTAASEVPATEMAYGAFVKSVDSNITISEYNAEKDAQEDVVYAVNTETKIIGAPDVKNIVAGSNIEIAYEFSGEQKVVKTLTVETTQEDAQ